VPSFISTLISPAKTPPLLVALRNFYGLYIPKKINQGKLINRQIDQNFILLNPSLAQRDERPRSKLWGIRTALLIKGPMKQLSNRPGKSLGYQTPTEVFREESTVALET
jgi:hypothetical protein